MVAIFVILTILVLIGIDALILRRQQVAEPSVPQPIDPHLPDGVFLHPGHSWLQVDRGGMVQVGVDNFLRGLIGGPDQIHARPVGARVEQGKPMMIVGKNGRHVQVPAPITGRIEAVNPELTRHPGWWGERHQEGWTYTIRPLKLGDEIEHLRVAEAAAGWLQAQTDRLTQWLTERAMVRGQLVPTLPDGGAPVEGALDGLDAEAWRDFEKSFLPDGTNWRW